MENTPQNVHARFSLTSTSRVRCYVANGQDPNNKWTPAEGCRVTMGAVQGEPFGPATPSGTFEMVIANPVAAQMFLEAPLDAQFDVVFSPVVPEEK